MEQFFSVALTIIFGLLILTALVVVHEFGHYSIARKLGIPVKEFGVGFGPKLIKWRRKGIDYSIRPIPLGGFTSFYDEYSEDEANKDTRAFGNHPVYKRFLTILAGPVYNFIFAIILAIAILSIYGDGVPVIAQVEDGMPAAEAGLLPGDRIVEVDGNRFDFFMEFNISFTNKEGDGITMGVERADEEISVYVPYEVDADGNKRLGFSYGMERHQFGFFEAFFLSFKWLWLIFVQMLIALKDLIFAGVGADQMMGPVGTISYIGTMAKAGIETTLQLAALVSINLGVMNLIPFPGLDGGRLVILGIEGIRRKPLPTNKEGMINLIGIGVLFLLIGIFTYQDIVRMISGG